MNQPKSETSSVVVVGVAPALLRELRKFFSEHDDCCGDRYPDSERVNLSATLGYCRQMKAKLDAALAAPAGQDANPCELHLEVRASGGYCPICLLNERDANALDARRWREIESSGRWPWWQAGRWYYDNGCERFSGDSPSAAVDAALEAQTREQK